MDVPLAHSPRGATPKQPYSDHIKAVVEGAMANALAATAGRGEAAEPFVAAVRAAAELHDLGKLNEENQAVLRRRSRDPLPIRHEDAGISYFCDREDFLPACLVAAHHTGLYERSDEYQKETEDGIPALRIPSAYADSQANLQKYLTEHAQVRPWKPGAGVTGPMRQGFGLRVGLSCLVDADHSDTARNYGEERIAEPPCPRWGERLARLQEYVQNLPRSEGERAELRDRFFGECLEADPEPNLRACDAPVGSGKTLAVMANLLRAAQAKGLRHIFVVLPYTNIIRQSVKVYRDALTLPGEDPMQVVAEHHHQADFSSVGNRHLATLWRAPITVTTAVQFFETLASHHPSRLRKIHELPRSAVFVDETHASIPPHLWRVTWGWLEEWLGEWGGHMVLASGSLPAFWRSEEFVGTPREDVPNLVSSELQMAMNALERSRIQPKRHEDALNLEGLIEFVLGKKGPRLVILNTVHNAALLATELRKRGEDVLHLSTALAPVHREIILQRIGARLKYPDDQRWTLVATSCLEAGVDYSFRTAIRECASAASLIQTGGRVRRHLEEWEGELWSVRLADERFNRNAALQKSAAVLDEMLMEGRFDELEPSDLILEAWHRELKQGQRDAAQTLMDAQDAENHVTISRLYNVIEADTRLVVVDPETIVQLRSGEKVTPIQLIGHSVQIWARKLNKLPISPIYAPQQGKRAELYAWEGEYAADSIGYMAGALEVREFVQGGGAIA